MSLFHRTSRERVARPRRTELGLLLFGCGIITVFYVLVSVGTSSRIPPHLGTFLGAIIALALVAHMANRLWAKSAHPVVLPIATLLNGLGWVMIARIDQHLASLQAAWTAVGVGAYVVTLFFVKRSRDLDRYRYLLLFSAAGLMLLPLVAGENINGARLWIKVGPITGQPVELAKLMLCIFFASYFSEKREILSIPTARIGNRLFVDPRPLGPILVAWGFAMVVLGAEHDIGFAVMLFTLFIAMLWLATGRLGYVLFGLVLFALGAYVASHLFAQVTCRVDIWLHPQRFYNNPAYPYCSSQQLTQGLIGMGTGHITGLGLGFGTFVEHIGKYTVFPIPEIWSDYIFAAFGTEMGFLGTASLVFAFTLLIGTGLRIAQSARSEFAKLTAAGLTVVLGMQAFFIMAGILDLLPLTGITLPFVAYGGSSLVANYVLIAFLMRISDEGSRPVVAAQATSAIT